MNWLDRIPMVVLVMVALWLAIAPITPEPHLIEKVRMLTRGELKRPIDIFDLFMHAAPLVLLLIRLLRQAKTKARVD